jgi:hypothetical protein
LTAGAGWPITQGKDFLVLWVLRRLPIRGVLVGTSQIVEICCVDFSCRTPVRRRLRGVAEALGETLFAGVEVNLDFNLLVLPRRGVVAH